MTPIVKVSRRDFVKVGGVGTAALVLGWTGWRYRALHNGTTASASTQLNAFLSVDSSSAITIWVGKSDMGQGVRTALPMLVAEELGAEWEQVRIQQADLDDKYGEQTTGGSTSIRLSWEPLRRAGAAAREMLVQAAAAQWGTEAAVCRVENGRVIHPDGRSFTFGALAGDAASRPVPENPRLKSPEEFTIIGRSVARQGLREIVTGAATYGIDVKVPGALVATMVRCPILGGTLRKVTDQDARQVPGVVDVVPIHGVALLDPFALTATNGSPHRTIDGVAVIAETTDSALRGREVLKPEWTPPDGYAESTRRFESKCREALDIGGTIVRNDGDIRRALMNAVEVVSADYSVPFLAHAPLEPMNCTAVVHEKGCEVWAPTQIPRAARHSIAHALGFRPDQVSVHVTLLGGSFGRRLNQDYAVEAALVARRVGRPVKLLWTREDDMQHGYFRPAAMHRLQGALDERREIAGWWHKIVSAPLSTYYRGHDVADPSSTELNPWDPPAGLVDSYRLEYQAIPSRVPRGWLRSVKHSGNTFVTESFVDELAKAASRDPIEFRLALLSKKQTLPFESPFDEGEIDLRRLRRVIEVAAERGGWPGNRQDGLGYGFAAVCWFPTYVAQMAVVRITDGRVRVQRVICAIDCGRVVHPDIVRAQVEGGIVFALGTALNNAITVTDGRIQQSNFDDYPSVRIDESPVVDVHIVESGHPPVGAGEPPVPPVAPAIANAIVNAGGPRLRKLPLEIG